MNQSPTQILRNNGLAQADKKSSRVFAVGKTPFRNERKAVLVEVNFETNSVNKDFTLMDSCERVAGVAVIMDGSDSVENLTNQDVNGISLESK